MADAPPILAPYPPLSPSPDRVLLRNQPFDFSEHLVLGKMFLRGSLVGTDGCAGPAGLAERLMDHGDPLVLKKLNSRIGADFNT